MPHGLGYGVSLALLVLALRDLGTARTGAYFSTAPFIGTVAAVLFLHEPPTLQLGAAGLLMAIGVWLHLTEQHDHEHVHEPMSGAGKLADNMDAAGIERKSVTRIVFTHAHPYHLRGMLDDFDDTPMFPNATHLISAAELNFWAADDVAARLPEDRQNFAPGARRNLDRIKGIECDRTWRGYRQWPSRNRYVRSYRRSHLDRDGSQQRGT